MREIKVTFNDGNYLYSKVNGTEQEILDYYLGKMFNLGVEEDSMVKCVGVEFLG